MVLPFFACTLCPTASLRPFIRDVNLSRQALRLEVAAVALR